MVKKYVMVSPPIPSSGDGFADLAMPVVYAFHMSAYERVCGYSLGHEVTFFDSLKAAQGIQEGVAAKNIDFFITRRVAQNAIIEIDVVDNKVIKFCKIHEISKLEEKLLLQEDRRTVEKVIVPKWKERAITASDYTKGALEDLTKKYREHLAKKNRASHSFH